MTGFIFYMRLSCPNFQRWLFYLMCRNKNRVKKKKKRGRETEYVPKQDNRETILIKCR